jgi:hypothetical protein
MVYQYRNEWQVFCGCMERVNFNKKTITIMNLLVAYSLGTVLPGEPLKTISYPAFWSAKRAPVWLRVKM